MVSKNIEYIDLRKISKEGLWQIRRQIVRLKKLGKPGKEIEELVGVRQNRISEIWSAYQREGEAAFEAKPYRSKPGRRMILSQEEQEAIRAALVTRVPGELGLEGSLWTLGKTAEYIEKKYHKKVALRTLSSYMERWGLRRQPDRLK